MLKNILTIPTDGLGRWSRFLILQTRMWRHCFRLLMKNKWGTQAAALSYHTVFGIMPLTIVMLMVFQMFPSYRSLGDKVKNTVYQQLHLEKIEYPVDTDKPGQTLPEGGQQKNTIKLTTKIDELTEQYMNKVNTGAITMVGIVLVIWAAIGLLTTIERAFNSIWRISRGRSFLHRMINYWAILTLGPLLLGVGFYIRTSYLLPGGLEEHIFKYISYVVPFLGSIMAFFFLYFVLPNTKVNVGAALWGAIIATLLWTAAKYGISVYMAKFIPYQAIYGMLGIIPLSVFWIWVTWLIVLFGLQLTYAVQNLKSLDAAELARLRQSNEYFIAGDASVIRIAACVESAFEDRNQQPVSAAQISSILAIPSEFVEKILNHLVRQGLFCQTTEPKVGYVPSTEGSNITLADISKAVAGASFANESLQSDKLDAIMQQQRNQLAKYTLKDILVSNQPLPAEIVPDMKEQTDTD